MKCLGWLSAIVTGIGLSCLLLVATRTTDRSARHDAWHRADHPARARIQLATFHRLPLIIARREPVVCQNTPESEVFPLMHRRAGNKPPQVSPRHQKLDPRGVM